MGCGMKNYGTDAIGVNLTKEHQLKEIFRLYDVNQDGLLSKEELKSAFKCLGAIFPGYRANRGLYLADANGDGYISEAELKALVKYASELGYSIK